jgi:CheY-like chemotaxis protein
MTPAANIAVANAAAKQVSNPKSAHPRATQLCLVVHEDMDLRLRLARLVRRAIPALDADSLPLSALESLSVEQLRSYRAVLLIIEFMKQGGSDPLAPVSRLLARAPLTPILVFARHGDERSAARAMRAGAVDYWPIHSVDVTELAASLQGFLAAGEPAEVQGPSKPSAPSESGNYPAVPGYRLLKKLAHSSSATVYLARNSDLAQMVALKIQTIRGMPGVSEEDRERFARECEILSSLNHRSIADVIDFGITPDYLYLALEYFPCGSMRERLKNPVSEADALRSARHCRWCTPPASSTAI